MIHRLALLVGGTGAAGVVALALMLGGFGTPLASTTDAAGAVPEVGLDGGQLPATTPAQAVPTVGANLYGGGPKTVTDTIYVVPPTAGPDRGRDNDGNQPSDTPRPAPDNNDDADHNGGGGQAGDDQGDDSNADDENDSDDSDDADEDHDDDHADEDHEGDHSDDGGSDDGGHEPGDD